jgi:2,4-dienoyl-CoA reductase-like NADH-dependent reductase (Old Yellow Enzyme family)
LTTLDKKIYRFLKSKTTRYGSDTPDEPALCAACRSRHYAAQPDRDLADGAVLRRGRVRDAVPFRSPGGFATGGAGLVFAESTKVERRGMGSVGDLCLWNETHVQALRPITRFIKAAGAVPGMQLNHSGRKARSQRPWEGFGPLQGSDEELWPVIAPSAVAHAEGWATPREMTAADIQEVIGLWAASARLAADAGFEVLEIHGAHGYLVHQFLSPKANRRNDQYGGSLGNRMRFALELTEAVRGAWPEHLPLFFRVSATDDMGWALEDTVTLAAALHHRGVDVIDCSSGGMTTRSPTASGQVLAPGYQVPYAERVRHDAGVATMAVGLITEPDQAEQILQEGRADLIAIGREALYDPFWARHAAQALEHDKGFADWPPQYGWWLERRARAGRARAR